MTKVQKKEPDKDLLQKKESVKNALFGGEKESDFSPTEKPSKEAGKKEVKKEQKPKETAKEKETKKRITEKQRLDRARATQVELQIVRDAKRYVKVEDVLEIMTNCFIAFKDKLSANRALAKDFSVMSDMYEIEEMIIKGNDKALREILSIEDKLNVLVKKADS